jgi:hypothetical protein
VNGSLILQASFQWRSITILFQGTWLNITQSPSTLTTATKIIMDTSATWIMAAYTTLYVDSSSTLRIQSSGILPSAQLNMTANSNMVISGTLDIAQSGDAQPYVNFNAGSYAIIARLAMVYGILIIDRDSSVSITQSLSVSGGIISGDGVLTLVDGAQIPQFHAQLDASIYIPAGAVVRWSGSVGSITSSTPLTCMDMPHVFIVHPLHLSYHIILVFC